MAVALAVASCVSTPTPGHVGYPFNVAGSYYGRFHVDGQAFDATLQLRTGPGGSVRGAFRVLPPVDIEGTAEGNVVDDLLRLRISYRDARDCDSRMEGILTVERGGGVIDGPVTIVDCGSETSGRMAFRRRDRTPRTP